MAVTDRSVVPALIQGFAGGAGAGGGAAGFLPGTRSAGYDPAYGGVPGVPSPTSTASSSIAGNLSNVSNIYNLATGTGAASGAGVIHALEQEIPGISGSIGAATGNINQLLSGQLPSDVVTQLQQQGAELGVGRGMGPMAPSTNAAYLRALGLTSLGMKEQGLAGLNSLMGSVPRAPAFDPSSMLTNPQSEQEWAYLAQVLANAPQPAAAANANVNALRSGVGAGSPSPIGGFNTPVRGGPAFTPSTPLIGPEDTGYPTFPVYGGTGDPSQYPTSLTPQAYQNWNNLASQWGTPGTSQEDIYNMGLSPAIEDTGAMSYEEAYGY